MISGPCWRSIAAEQRDAPGGARGGPGGGRGRGRTRGRGRGWSRTPRRPTAPPAHHDGATLPPLPPHVLAPQATLIPAEAPAPTPGDAPLCTPARRRPRNRSRTPRVAELGGERRGRSRTPRHPAPPADPLACGDENAPHPLGSHAPSNPPEAAPAHSPRSDEPPALPRRRASATRHRPPSPRAHTPQPPPRHPHRRAQHKPPTPVPAWSPSPSPSPSLPGEDCIPRATPAPPLPHPTPARPYPHPPPALFGAPLPFSLPPRPSATHPASNPAIRSAAASPHADPTPAKSSSASSSGERGGVGRMLASMQRALGFGVTGR